MHAILIILLFLFVVTKYRKQLEEERMQREAELRRKKEEAELERKKLLEEEENKKRKARQLAEREKRIEVNV